MMVQKMVARTNEGDMPVMAAYDHITIRVMPQLT
jgi:hypothetical protein